jgi:hypothetical protein
MSLSYSDFPVYIGEVGVGVSAPSEVNGYIPATQASVNYNTNHSPKRKLGKTIASDDQFGFNSALTADISIDCVFHTGMLSGLDFLKDANQDNFVVIQLGSGLYDKCYATDVSISISPFAPVTLNANFVSLSPAVGGIISGDPSPYSGSVVPLDSDAVAYGHTCAVSDNADVLNDVQSQISFKRSYARSPVYNIGSINASSMLLDGVEEEITVASTGLNSLINFSGEALSNTLEVSVCGIGGTTVMTQILDLIKFNVGSRVLTQSYSNQGGETLTASSTIKQIKL